VRKHRRDAPRTIEIEKILGDAARTHPSETLDTQPIDRIISGLSEQTRWHIQFLVGAYLRAHRQDNLARSYLERCAQSPYATKWFTALARDQVREIAQNTKSPQASPALAR